MSIYSKVESGTSFHRSRFSKSISYTKKYDCQFGRAIPVLEKFVLPGDIWRIGGDALVRFQPQLAPSLTASTLRVRYFFVPLRLLESNAELVITGSKDGHLFSGELPVLPNMFTNADKTEDANCFKISKHTISDYFGIQCGDYEKIKNEKFIAAEYWQKGYYRILWDYYWDENLNTNRSYFSDFESFWNTKRKHGGNQIPEAVSLPKDYFTSSLPWQLKGTAPVVPVEGLATFTPNYLGGNFVTAFNMPDTEHDEEATRQMFGNPELDGLHDSGKSPLAINRNEDETNIAAAYAAGYINQRFIDELEKEQQVNLSGLGFNADELRTMMAQTRIFERLARTGSRYTEYLRANFGTAPADDTLQRAQYLGGWKLPIVTTEVLQTAEDGSTPVGTMRGHAITRGGNRINTFFAKEFGIILGIAHILPNIEYTTGSPREMSYKSRFDFFNPSLQHLSEQEVRNGELYVDFTGGDSSDNDETFGFQAYANELRSSINKTVGDLRDSLAYWNQSINFNSRPELNHAFITASSYLANFNQNFAVNGENAYPCIVQFRNNLDVYRPMVRYATPGLVDHY